jgi:transmembrane sensor
MTNPSDEPKLSELKQQAIDWLILLRSDEVSKEELAAFAAWMAIDTNHGKAYADAEKLFDQIILTVRSDTFNVQEQALPEKQSVPSPPPDQQTQQQQLQNQYKRSKRWLFPASIAIAASLLFTTLLGSFLKNNLFEIWLSDYHTQAGEIREIAMVDGSRLLLDSKTAVSVNYNESGREIILHHGRVRFTVAKDPVRAFNVLANGLKIQALGTVFQVYNKEHDGVNIAVQEHAVAVRLNSSSQQQVSNEKNTVTIKTRQQLSYHPGHALASPLNSELSRETAWQKQQLIVIDQPLKDLITELERYHRSRILISDKKLNSLHVTGVFSLKNPDSVLNSVCQILNLQKTSLGPWWIVLHR